MTAASAPSRAAPAWVVLCACTALFAPWIFAFEARSTDLSALRVAHGDVPYRDFWSMYAPGSFLVMALVFRVLGEQLAWSNLLGVLTAASAVTALHALVAREAPRGVALVLAFTFALAFLHSGYHDGFGSYPPAILCVLLAFLRVAAFADRRRRGKHWRRAVHHTRRSTRQSGSAAWPARRRPQAAGASTRLAVRT